MVPSIHPHPFVLHGTGAQGLQEWEEGREMQAKNHTMGNGVKRAPTSNVCHINASKKQALPCLSSAFVSGPWNVHYALFSQCGQQQECEVLSNPLLIMYL